MHPILLQWGNLQIFSYGLFVSLGVLAATLWTVRKVNKQGRSPQFVIDLVLLVVVAGIIGARLAYVFFYESRYYLAHPWQILMLQGGGLAFYGALVLGLLAGYLYLRRIGEPFLGFLDLVSPALALGYSIARIGCFLAGCCYGIVTTRPWGVIFPAVDLAPRHPTQLYSMLAGFLIFITLEFLSRRVRFRGQIFSVFLILYGLSRSIIELFRENLVLSGGVGIASLAALAIAVAGGLLYFFLARRGATAVSSNFGVDRQ